jgi:hypothetical protein
MFPYNGLASLESSDVGVMIQFVSNSLEHILNLGRIASHNCVIYHSTKCIVFLKAIKALPILIQAGLGSLSLCYKGH